MAVKLFTRDLGETVEENSPKIDSDFEPMSTYLVPSKEIKEEENYWENRLVAQKSSDKISPVWRRSLQSILKLMLPDVAYSLKIGNDVICIKIDPTCVDPAKVEQCARKRLFLQSIPLGDESSPSNQIMCSFVERGKSKFHLLKTDEAGVVIFDPKRTYDIEGCYNAYAVVQLWEGAPGKIKDAKFDGKWCQLPPAKKENSAQKVDHTVHKQIEAHIRNKTHGSSLKAKANFLLELMKQQQQAERERLTKILNSKISIDRVLDELNSKPLDETLLECLDQMDKTDEKSTESE